MATGITMGNAQGVYLVKATLSPAEVATITTAEQTFTLSGALTTDAVYVTPPGHQAGVVAAAARITAANTVGITFVNPTAGGVTPTAGVYLFTVVRAQGNIPNTMIAD